MKYILFLALVSTLLMTIVASVAGNKDVVVRIPVSQTNSIQVSVQDFREDVELIFKQRESNDNTYSIHVLGPDSMRVNTAQKENGKIVIYRSHLDDSQSSNNNNNGNNGQSNDHSISPATRNSSSMVLLALVTLFCMMTLGRKSTFFFYAACFLCFLLSLSMSFVTGLGYEQNKIQIIVEVDKDTQFSLIAQFSNTVILRLNNNQEPIRLESIDILNLRGDIISRQEDEALLFDKLSSFKTKALQGNLQFYALIAPKMRDNVCPFEMSAPKGTVTAAFIESSFNGNFSLICKHQNDCKAAGSRAKIASKTYEDSQRFEVEGKTSDKKEKQRQHSLIAKGVEVWVSFGDEECKDV